MKRKLAMIPLGTNTLDLELLELEIRIAQKGGPGSGNWGHRGRTGKEGGSVARGSSDAGDTKPKQTATLKINFEENYVELIRNHPDPAGLDRVVNQSTPRQPWDQHTDYVKSAYGQIEARLSEAPVCIAISPAALDKVVDSGRFKTQFETNKSGGLLNTARRAEFEQQYMGVPESVSADRRPIYGFMEMSKIPGGTESVDQYGEVIVKLKSSVRERTTITGGDSLDTSLNPSPLQGRDGSIGFQKKSHWMSLSNPDGRALADAPFVPRTNTDWARAFPMNYVEAQIWGGVTVSDIDRVYDPKGKLSQAKIKKLEKAGIPVIRPVTPRDIRKETEAYENAIYAQITTATGLPVYRAIKEDEGAGRMYREIPSVKREIEIEILDSRLKEMGAMEP